MLQVSVRRSRASWPIVGSAGLICVLATTLMAAGPTYANAVSLAGLHRVLRDAPVAEANLQVSLRIDPESWTAADELVSREIAGVLGAPGGTIERYGRSDTFALPGAPTGELIDLTQLGFAEGLEAHADLTAGGWPSVALGDVAPIPVVVNDGVAERLGLRIGQELRLESRATAGFATPVTIVGIFRIDDPADPFWWDDPQAIDGLTTSDRFATHGPFFAAPATFLARANPGRAELGWHARPNVEALTLADVGVLRSRVDQLDQRLEGALGGPPVTVATELPAILQSAERSLLASRTGVLLLTAQFMVVAAYAVLLSAALLVEHRRMDTAMLRSRGAGPARIAALSAVEGLLLTIPAALLGPVLAAMGLRVLGVVGPLADIGLRIEPVVASDAFVASAGAAAACLIAMLIPAIPRIRSFAAIHGSAGRSETRTAGQRFGLDVALLAIAGIGLWQLRHYGAPLTRSIQGTLGIDPLLIATPAIGLLAGAVVALRVVPLVAALIERGTARRRGLVPALGARQLSRRPLRYTRAALLLMLAMAMGVFAITYTGTWTGSQRDQATFQTGADVRAEPGQRSSGVPAREFDRAVAALPGVTAQTAVMRSQMRIPRVDVSGELLALDTERAAASVVRIRPDLLDGRLDDLLAPLAGARPDPHPIPLPGEPRRLRFDLRVAIETLEGPVTDPETGELVAGEVDPRILDGRPGVRASVVLRDASGHLHRLSGSDATLGDGTRRIEVPLSAGTNVDASLAYPLELLGLAVTLELPPTNEITRGTIEIEHLEATDETDAGAAGWQAVPLALDGGWALTASVYGLPHQVVGDRVTGEGLSAEVPDDGLPTVRGVDLARRGTVLTFAPAELDRIDADPIPVIATDRYLDATAGVVGDTVPLDIGGTSREARIVGAIRAFPTIDPATPALIIDLPTLTLLRFDASHATDPPDEWWLAVDATGADDVVQRLRDPSIGGAAVVGLEERASALASDPVALGVIGALVIGVAAAAAFAIVGFIVSAAVSARERVTEFALLRALGLSSRQLSGWLSLENTTLAVISLVAGSALGLLVSWVTLPFVTVTQRAETAYPPLEVTVPWTTIAILEVAGIAALVAAIVGLTWSLGRRGMASALRMGED